MNKIKVTALFIIAAATIACSHTKKSTSSIIQGGPNALSINERENGWQLLFDGKTLNGWHTYGKDQPGEAWKVQDGAIMLQTGATEGYQSKGGGDLVTNEEYDNFDLQLDWKISPKGNSGVILYVKEDPAKYHETWNTGMEMQVLDNGTATAPGHPDALIVKHRAGDLYDLIVSKEAVKPVGEWNHVEVTSNKGKLDFNLNGVHTVSTTMWNDEWRQMIAGSKFKDMPDFGTFQKGKLALQDHGHQVWFKNIKIKRF